MPGGVETAGAGPRLGRKVVQLCTAKTQRKMISVASVAACHQYLSILEQRCCVINARCVETAGVAPTRSRLCRDAGYGTQHRGGRTHQTDQCQDWKQTESMSRRVYLFFHTSLVCLMVFRDRHKSHFVLFTVGSVGDTRSKL